MSNFFHGPELIEKNEYFSVYKLPIPSYYACALINGDDSGLTSSGRADLETFVADIKEFLECDNIHFVSCEENTYVAKFYGLQSEMVDAIIHVH